MWGSAVPDTSYHQNTELVLLPSRSCRALCVEGAALSPQRDVSKASVPTRSSETTHPLLLAAENNPATSLLGRMLGGKNQERTDKRRGQQLPGAGRGELRVHFGKVKFCRGTVVTAAQRATEPSKTVKTVPFA